MERIRIGEFRYIRVTEHFIIIEDDLTKKNAALNFQKWMKLGYIIDEIDAAVSKVSSDNKDVVVNLHKDIGENWYVSVSSKVYCVDIRKFYKADDQLKPSKQGIGLRFREWNKLKEAVQKIHTDRPDIATVVPCYLSEDHQNQEGW